MPLTKMRLVVLLLSFSCMGADAPESAYRQIVTAAIRTGGDEAVSARRLLGAINDPVTRELIDQVLKGKNGAAIADVAAGLTPAQCVSYLEDLKAAAGDPEVRAKAGILDAIGLAGTPRAADILVAFANTKGGYDAGVAFGELERIGKPAEPALIRLAQNSESVWALETAISILRRMRDTAVPALVVYRSALRHPDPNVQVAGALALAQMGSSEGGAQIEAAAADSHNSYHIDALVALAMMGKPEAFDKLKSLITGPDEAVRGRAVWAVARSGNPMLKEFAYRLQLDRQPVFSSMIAEKLLDPRDARDKTALRRIVAEGDEMSRLIAAKRLLEVENSLQLESAISRAIASENETVRQLAVKYASQVPALRPVIAAQLSSTDANVQLAALSAIADLEQRERFADVANYLASPVPAVSAAAARTLVALDPIAANPVLMAALNSVKNYVRVNSAAMLLGIAARQQSRFATSAR